MTWRLHYVIRTENGQQKNGSVRGQHRSQGESDVAMIVSQIGQVHRKEDSHKFLSRTQSGVVCHHRPLPLRPALSPATTSSFQRTVLRVKLEDGVKGGQQRVNEYLVHKKDSFKQLISLVCLLNHPIYL